MQIVFRARTFANAQDARDRLVAAGIPAHLADQSLWDVVGQLPRSEVIRVLVDNRRLDQARRVVAAWRAEGGKDSSP